MNTALRYIECAVFVGVWMAFAWIFDINTGGYCLLGIPLVVLFQLMVARRPIQQLWVRDASAFRLNHADYAVAVGLMLMPVVAVSLEIHRHSWGRVASSLCAVLGAFPAAFALRQQKTEKFRQALPGFIAAIAIGFIAFAVDAVHDGRSPGFALTKLPIFAFEFLTMFTICFLLEEVVFRGALDTHVFLVSKDRRQGWASAIFIGVLFALWHLPNRPHPNLQDLVIMTALGVSFSICWRRSGTLVLPAVAHALIDTYRNLIAGG